MKKISFLLLFFICPCTIANILAGNPSDTTYVKTKHYEGIIFGKNYPKNYVGVDTNKRWNPTLEDIAIAEKILNNFLKKYGWKYIDKIKGRHHEDYIRQYLGDLYTGNRILKIQCFWKGIINSFPSWKTNALSVIGGATAFWYMDIDMDKQKVIMFYIDERCSWNVESGEKMKKTVQIFKKMKANKIKEW